MHFSTGKLLFFLFLGDCFENLYIYYFLLNFNSIIFNINENLHLNQLSWFLIFIILPYISCHSPYLLLFSCYVWLFATPWTATCQTSYFLKMFTYLCICSMQIQYNTHAMQYTCNTHANTIQYNTHAMQYTSNTHCLFSAWPSGFWFYQWFLVYAVIHFETQTILYLASGASFNLVGLFFQPVSICFLALS